MITLAHSVTAKEADDDDDDTRMLAEPSPRERRKRKSTDTNTNTHTNRQEYTPARPLAPFVIRVSERERTAARTESERERHASA